jgi:hypothetical protein
MAPLRSATVVLPRASVADRSGPPPVTGPAQALHRSPDGWSGRRGTWPRSRPPPMAPDCDRNQGSFVDPVSCDFDDGWHVTVRLVTNHCRTVIDRIHVEAGDDTELLGIRGRIGLPTGDPPPRLAALPDRPPPPRSIRRPRGGGTRPSPQQQRPQTPSSVATTAVPIVGNQPTSSSPRSPTPAASPSPTPTPPRMPHANRHTQPRHAAAATPTPSALTTDAHAREPSNASTKSTATTPPSVGPLINKASPSRTPPNPTDSKIPADASPASPTHPRRRELQKPRKRHTPRHSPSSWRPASGATRSRVRIPSAAPTATNDVSS